MIPKYQDNSKLCYVKIDRFNISIETEDVYENIDNYIEKRFDTSNYEFNWPLPTGKNKKFIGFIKYQLGGKILTEFVALRPKIYSYLMDDDNSNKKAKGTKKCVTKRILKFNDCKTCLFQNEITLKPQYRDNEAHNAYTEEINKTALGSNDDKIFLWQTFHRTKACPYGYKRWEIMQNKIVKM